MVIMNAGLLQPPALSLKTVMRICLCMHVLSNGPPHHIVQLYSQVFWIMNTVATIYCQTEYQVDCP